jgi:hypothetical protein
VEAIAGEVQRKLSLGYEHGYNETNAIVKSEQKPHASLESSMVDKEAMGVVSFSRCL